MSRLTADTTRGIWAGVPMVWDASWRFDENVYAGNVKRMIDAGAHGIYTTGSTGEFYAIEHDEFCAMVDIVADLCGKAGMPLQIGCCADATGKTLRLLEYAQSKSAVGAAQLSLPYWMELTDAEVLQFFTDVFAACPDLPLIHYNIPRAKRFLHGDDYVRILDVAPTLIGVKYTFAGSHFADLQESMLLTPQLSYFVGETLLASAMLLGARGSYSSLIMTNPSYMLDMYSHAVEGRWQKSAAMQQELVLFSRRLGELLAELGCGDIDPVADKGLAVAAGCAMGHQRCRAPYIGWSDQAVQRVRQWMAENYPHLLWPTSM